MKQVMQEINCKAFLPIEKLKRDELYTRKDKLLTNDKNLII